MRVILDTNILIAALITTGTPPSELYVAWKRGRFVMLSCARQIEEFREVTRRSGVSMRIRPIEAGQMVNSIRGLSVMVDPVPSVDRSPDPNDDFLLGLAQAGDADYLVTGDRSGLLALARHGRTRIVTARSFADLLGGRA
jgi:putative PIN family toxin of toxin-antitoxin system